MTVSSPSKPGAPSSSAPPAVQFSAVVKKFDKVAAVNELSMTVPHDELLVLVGPSGCGKSTLLRLAGGLTSLDRGSIKLHGQEVDDSQTSVPAEKRNVGLVFQDHALFPHLTVHGNVGFGLEKRRRGKESPRIQEMLDLVGMGGYKDRYPHELSGGEQQRVAVARALAPEPSLLLLDEPFASLDTNLRAQIRRDVVDIVRQTNIPTILVTHEQSEALSIGDRIVVMNNGRIAQSGPADEIFHKPTNKFVAEFMGEADFLPVVTSDNEATSELGSATIDRSISKPLMMIRPDDLKIEQDSKGPAEVVHREFRGATQLFSIRLTSGQIVRSEMSHLAEMTVGARVSVSFNAGHTPVIVES